MSSFGLDLGAPTFWLATAAGAVLLAPIVRPWLRKGAECALNLSVLTVVLGPGTLPHVVGLLAAVHVVLRWVHVSKAIPAVAGLALLSLFVLHKVPVHDWGGTKAALAGIGFSYVVLRLIDLARAVIEKRHPPPDALDTVNYLVPFHMLAAGPIQSYDDYRSRPDLPERPTAKRTLDGVDRIATGLVKKFVLAQLIASTLLTEFRAPFPYSILELQAYYVWVYLDFSAYSDIAVGVGTLLGLRTPENFQKPLLARNMIDFWDRWHITLSLFIRRNVFIPLQVALSRRFGGSPPLLIGCAAFTVSFLVCGLWHGIAMPFVLWGAMHALGLVVCNVYRHVLKARLGRSGMQTYLASRPIRFVAVFITFQWVASSLALIAGSGGPAP